MIRALSFALVIALAACGGGGATDTTTPDPEPTGPTCETAVENVLVQIRAGAGDEVSEDQYSRIHATLLQSCTNDAWSTETIRCTAKANHDELQACEQLFPPTVRDRLDAELEAILDEGKGDVPE